MKKAFSLVLVLSFLVSAAIFSVHAMEGHDETAITFLSGKRGYSTISYQPSFYEYCKGNLVVNSNGNGRVEYDESGIIPVITLTTNDEIAFSYDSNNSRIRNLVDDPAQMVLDIDLGASIRSGAIIVEQKTDNDFDTVSIATDVFREDAASLAGFFKPAYADILKGVTYRIIVAYATVAKNQTQIQRVIEIYEVKLQANSTGVSFIENLPDNVIVDLLGDVGSAEALDLYRVGGTLLSGSVTPMGFTVKLQNQAADVQVSYNGGEYKPAANNMEFTKQGKYSFRIQSCTGELEERIIYITHPEELFLETYFPMGIVKGERLFDLESELPVWSLNSKIELPQNNQFLPPLYGSLVNLCSGDEQEISPASNTLYLNKPGRYVLSLRNAPSEETPGTRISFSYVFQIASPSNPYTTFNLQNLRNADTLSGYRAQHWELDIYENSKLIHLCFSSADAAREVAAQYGTVVHERCWDYTVPGQYSQTDAEEVWLWANKIERELAKCPTQVIPSEFIFIKCETQEVRAYEYATGSIKKVELGIPIQLQQFTEGRYHITEILSSGERVEYDVYYADGVNRVSYSLHYDDKLYTVSGETKHCVNSQGPVSVTDILNRWDEGIIKIESATDALLLPIAQTTDITLEGGFYKLWFIDRLGQIVELEVNSASSILTQLEVAEPSVASEVSPVSSREQHCDSNATLIAIGTICGIICCCGSIIFIQKRRKRK